MKSVKTTENTEGTEDFFKEKSQTPDPCPRPYFLLSVLSVSSVVNLSEP